MRTNKHAVIVLLAVGSIAIGVAGLVFALRAEEHSFMSMGAPALAFLVVGLSLLAAFARRPRA
jgi:hypothetical protein